MTRLTHGKHNTRIYYIWKAMLARCNNPNTKAYKNYGGRGIKVSCQWHFFENFYADMGDRPEGLSLDRIDNDGGYNAKNCRWATIEEQNKNKQKKSKTMTHNGETLTIQEWADKTGINSACIYNRLSKGWSDEEAIMVPIVREKRGVKRGEKLRL